MRWRPHEVCGGGAHTGDVDHPRADETASFVLNDGSWLHVQVTGDAVGIWRDDVPVAEGVDRRLLDPQVIVPLPNAPGTIGVSMDYVGNLSATHDGRSLRRVGERAPAPLDLLRPRRWLLGLALVQWLPFLVPLDVFEGAELLSDAGLVMAVMTGIALIPYLAPSFAFFSFAWFGVLHAVCSWIVLTHPDARLGDHLLRGAIAGVLLHGWNVSRRHRRHELWLKRSYRQPIPDAPTTSWWSDDA